MARVSPLQESFNAGELTEKLEVRTTFNKYQSGLKTCVNLIPMIEGGVTRRPGTRYVAEIKSSAVKSKLGRFLFSTTQAYVFEMGAGNMRFYRFQAQIVAANITASITNGTFTDNINDWTDRSTSSSSIAHDSTNGRLNLVGVGGNESSAEQVVTNSSALAHSLKFRVLGSPGDIVNLRVGTSSTGSQILSDRGFAVGYHCFTFTSTAANFYLQFSHSTIKTLQIDDVSLIDNSAIEVDTPYAAADLFNITGPQSADVRYFFHKSYPTYKLARYAHTSWSLIQVAWEDGPYFDMNETATTLGAGATTGNGIVITASAIVGINDNEGFKATDVGRLIRLDNPSSGIDWGYGIITEFTDTTHVKVDIKRDFLRTNADVRWMLGAWSETTGYPSKGTFHEQRLVAAGSTDRPQNIWLSQASNDFEDMSPDSAARGKWDGTVEDDDAMAWTISSDEVATVQWVLSSRRLLVGTVGGEWIMSSSGAVITPTGGSVHQDSRYGRKQIQPVLVSSKALFVQRAGRKVIEYGYNFQEDGYLGFDMTRLASHVTFGGITQMAFAQEANRVLWAVRTDGVLLGMSYNRDEDVIGWCRSVIGGAFSSGAAVVESVVSIPGDDGTASGQVKDSTDRDEVWVIVKRTINSATKRYIEVIEREYETGHDQEDAYYVDSAITYDGSAATAMSGLGHLEGQTVSILADGAIQDPKPVSSGALTLDTAASVVQIGLPYKHSLKTLKLDFGALSGTAVGKKKKVKALTFVLLNSHTISYGPSVAGEIDKAFRVVSDPMDAATPFFTGEGRVDFEHGWEDDARIYLDNSDPVPFTLLGIAPEMQTNDLF